MTDHLRMKGKDALTIGEAEIVLSANHPQCWSIGSAYGRAMGKVEKALAEAISRRDTREHMRKQGAAAAERAGFTSEQLREAAKKAGVKIVPEGKR